MADSDGCSGLCEIEEGFNGDRKDTSSANPDNCTRIIVESNAEALATEGEAAATSSQGAAAGAAGAAVAASLLSGSVNLQSIWSMANTFQLLMVIGLLDIDFPPKLDAYFHSFDFALFALPDELNLVEKMAAKMPNVDLDDSETDERYQSYEFESPLLLLQ